MPSLKSIFSKALHGVSLAGSIFPIPDIVGSLAKKGAEALSGAEKADKGWKKYQADFLALYGRDEADFTKDQWDDLEGRVRAHFTASRDLQKTVGAMLASMPDALEE
jgi:phytoene dehydrogenase-like protein